MVVGCVQEHVEETLPWLLALLSSESSSVERSGAALGLAEVVAVLGEAHLQAIIPGIVTGCTSKSASVRDGNLTLLVHLPTTCRRTFEPHLEEALPCIVLGLADEAEEVRATSMAAAMKIVDLYATSSTPLLMPVLEVRSCGTPHCAACAQLRWKAACFPCMHMPCMDVELLCTTPLQS